MTGVPSEGHRAAQRAFFDAAGGEIFGATSSDGNNVVLSALPVPDGTVRMLLCVTVPGVGPFGLQTVLTGAQVVEVGELLARVGAR